MLRPLTLRAAVIEAASEAASGDRWLTSEEIAARVGYVGAAFTPAIQAVLELMLMSAGFRWGPRKMSCYARRFFVWRPPEEDAEDLAAVQAWRELPDPRTIALDVINADLRACAETLYLTSIPGMVESIQEARAIPTAAMAAGSPFDAGTSPEE